MESVADMYSLKWIFRSRSAVKARSCASGKVSNALLSNMSSDPGSGCGCLGSEPRVCRSAFLPCTWIDPARQSSPRHTWSTGRVLAG